MERHYRLDIRQPPHLEVGCAHGGLNRAEGMLDGAAPQGHRVGISAQALSYLVDQMLVLPSRDPAFLAESGAGLIPHRSNRKTIPQRIARAPYRGRARTEQMIGKLKRLKRVALRCEETTRKFRSIVALAATFILVKSVQTA